MDGLTVEVHTERLVAAFDTLQHAIATLTYAAAQVTAEAIAREARARVARRHPPLTKAQEARPPIEQLISVAEMRNRTGWVVIVQDPQAPFLPWQLEYGTKDMSARTFFFPSAKLERDAHERRMLAAAVEAVSLAEQT